MKKIIALLFSFAFALAVLAGCGANAAQPAASAPVSGSESAAPEPAAQSGEPLKVVATIFPPYDFVRAIAGDKVELTMLLPPGAESHSFEPTPQDIITIQNCDVFIHAGGESDAWIEDILGSMDTGGMRVLSIMKMVEAKPEELVEGMEDEDEHAHAEDGHEETHAEDEHEAGHDEAHAAEEAGGHDAEEPELDEHVWTSPKNAMRIVQVISGVLGELDSANAGLYQQNADAYIGELEALDAAFADVVANGARKTLVFGDRFPFRYLADAYGLEYYAAFPGCSTQTEPSAATVAFLIDKVKSEDIPVVFHIELSNEKMADTICADTGAKKLLLDSCHNVTREQMDAGATYLTLMRQNVVALKEALQ